MRSIANTYLRTITLIRHAQTADNATGVISGRIDTRLSAEGRDFAAAYVERNGHIAADLLVSSPLRRATETASIMFDLDSTEFVTDKLCVERNYGRLEGASPAEVAAMDVSYLEVGGIKHSLNPPDGETFEDLRARADAFHALLLDAPADHVACVSHQVFLQQLHGAFRGLDHKESLAIDILPLEIHRYTLQGTTVLGWTRVFAGAQHLLSW